jgi:hypothetical protein
VPAYLGPDPSAAEPGASAPAVARQKPQTPGRLVPVAAVMAGGAVLAGLAAALLLLYRIRTRRRLG